MTARLRPGARRALWGVAALTLIALAVSVWWERRHSEPPPLGPPSAGLPARLELVAGDGHRGTVDGDWAQARFDDPYGIAVAADGTVFVAEGGASNRIRRIAADGRVDTFAGGAEGFADGRGAQARLHTPSGLAIDAAGTLLVADTGNHAIRAIAPDGTVTTLAGTGEAGFADGPAAQARFHAPTGVAVDAAGRVLVADGFNDRIRVIEHGQVRTLAGDGQPGFADGSGRQARFDTPSGVAVDAEGIVWVADTGNHALRRIATDGTTTTQGLYGNDPDAAPSAPVSIAIDAQGRLYLGELARGRVLQIAPDGRTHVLTGRDMAQRLARPTGLAFDAWNRLWVADAAAYRVHRVVQVRPQRTKQNLTNAAVGPAPDSALPDTRGRWPLAPQDGWHEVVGTLGEVRGNFRGESRHHLHAGFDVRGDVGSPVLVIADAKIASPFAAAGFGDQAEHLVLDDLTYMHMRVGRTPRGEALDPRFQLIAGDDGRTARVRIARGTRLRAGDAIGTINAQAHVHLMVGPPGYQRNAIGLGFRHFVDTVAPRIDDLALLDASDRPIVEREDGRLRVPREGGGVQIVVEAWDQVDGNLPRRRLGLHALGWQLLTADGTPLPGFETPMMTIDFDRMPPHREAVRVAYAADSGITVHGASRTRFRYAVNNVVRDGRLEPALWDPATLTGGDYVLRAVVRDASGNTATRELPLRLH
ncbi:gluconolaconase [Luteimonas sp. S4-F44]|uniref:NHL repeat-containing protein n=1 Tax=Luteimonas sp. S4-F44 TaxID=2925842 RepID=UPI001F53DE4C|nr:NHL repeat-containing protein [Luteimonas sp. S4-F44]UNK42627.1 gluconolaconase [Luteimonas sp. S4-F44]